MKKLIAPALALLTGCATPYKDFQFEHFTNSKSTVDIRIEGLRQNMAEEIEWELVQLDHWTEEEPPRIPYRYQTRESTRFWMQDLRSPLEVLGHIDLVSNDITEVTTMEFCRLEFYDTQEKSESESRNRRNFTLIVEPFLRTVIANEVTKKNDQTRLVTWETRPINGDMLVQTSYMQTGDTFYTRKEPYATNIPTSLYQEAVGFCYDMLDIAQRP